jgi:hypothetical protein
VQTKANELAEMGTVNDNLRAELEEVKVSLTLKVKFPTSLFTPTRQIVFSDQ